MYLRLDKLVTDIPGVQKSETAFEADSLSTSIDESEPIDFTIAKKQIEILEASSQALLKRVEDLEGAEPTTKYITATTSQNFQKQIVHVGSASTRENNWTDTGVEVTLNTEDYPSNINANFEVGISIISGVGWARLVNKTTGAVMAITEVSGNTSETSWKSSPKFKLHSGTNMYEVQARSSSGELVNISSARIILTQ